MSTSERRIKVARGLEKADLVLKNGWIINVFTMNVEKVDVAICEGIICGVGIYEGIEEVDCTGYYIAPGFMDSHIHIESSMLHPQEFSNAVVPHGTTTIYTDPHEIANVCGVDGIDFMLDATGNIPLDVFFLLPSCIPSSPFDESGAFLDAEKLKPYYDNSRVLGLAELMDYEGTISGSRDILKKLEDASGKIVDGHGPSLSGKDLCAYVTAGVLSDHECTTLQEAKERIRLGQTVMIREGTAAKNLESLIDLFAEPYYQRCILATDDRHPGSLKKEGHINFIIRKAVSFGVDPIKAIAMSTYQTARYFNLKDRGAIAPHYIADIVVLEDLKEFYVKKVYKKGKLVAENGNMIEYLSEPKNTDDKYKSIYHSFHISKLEESDFYIEEPSGDKRNQMRVISLVDNQITTTEQIEEYEPENNGINIHKDILKLAVVERHKGTGSIGLGYVSGYGLKSGAIASSVSHDSHNLIIIGTNEKDMALAANTVQEMEGGYVITNNGVIIDKLPLPIAGLMSDKKAEDLAEDMDKIKKRAYELGIAEGVDPFMTLAFISLPVIPELRLTTKGLVNVKEQKLVPNFLEG